MNKLQKIDNKITLEKVNSLIYYSYKIVKILIFLLNIYIIFKYINHHEPKFLILCFIFNLIYLCIYPRRLWIIILCGFYFYFLTNNLYHSLFLAFAGGNAISYIIDLIIIKFVTLILNFIDKLSHK